MRWDLALYDLIAPYLLRGAPVGAIHAVISVIQVQEFDTAIADGAVVIRGKALLRGEAGAALDLQTMSLTGNASNTEGHPRDDDGRRDPWIDLRDSNIVFELTAVREASTVITAAAGGLDAGDDAEILGLLNGLDAIPGDAAPSDYASTAFTLDMVITAAVLRFPFLKGARLLDDGRLAPLEGDDSVAITLPRFKLRVSQGSGPTAALDVSMVSFGVDGLDDPADLGVVDLVRMDPPYAFIGESRIVGIGFRTATLDLSTGATPPEVLEQFGFDASWTGLYLPELRLFVQPNGLEDFAVSASAQNLLIGWGTQPGVTGDFGLSVIDLGSGALHVSARFVDPSGRIYGITRVSDATATAQIPIDTTLVVDVTGGRPPYAVTVDGAAGRVHPITLDPDGDTLTIAVTDASAPPLNTTLDVVVSRYRPEITVTPGRPGRVSIVEQETRRDGDLVALPALAIVEETATHVTVRLRGAAGDVAWSSGDSGATAAFAIAEGELIEVEATLSQPEAGPPPLQAFFRYDKPKPYDNGVAEYVNNPNNSHTTPAVGEGPNADWSIGGAPVMATYSALIGAVPPGEVIAIEGTASYEGYDGPIDRIYNYDLARERALAFQRMIETAFPSRFVFEITPPALATAQPPLDWVDDWHLRDTDRHTHWQATATLPAAAPPDAVTTATLRRSEAVEDVVVALVDPPPAEPSPPDWFRSVALKVRIVQNSFVAIELSGEIDVQTAAEQQMSAGDLGDGTGLGQNPADGIVAYRILVQVDDAAQTWTASATLGADPADVDGLWMAGLLPNAGIVEPNSEPALNMLGVTTAMAPVLATTAPENPLNGDVGALILSGAALAIPAALSGLGWLTVQRVILYGGEILVRDRPTGPEMNFLFDVETAIGIDISIGSATGSGGFTLLEIPAEDPLVVRYRSVGVRLGYTPETGDRFQFRPVFDSSKGYTIEVGGPGGIRVAEPIGRIMKVLAARLARQNPMTFEIDLGFSADLGVVSVERARVRVPIHPPGPPELTAFAASIDIPAVIRATGYLEMGSSIDPATQVEISEVRGGLDLTIVPIKLRIRAEMAIAQIPAAAGGPATGVVVSIEVNFPAPIPLGASGLGLLGVLGLFAMHYGRNVAPFEDAATPALAWLEATGGDPTRLSPPQGAPGPDYWTPQIDRWAFGVGAVLGTMEGGVIFNLKGVFLLELPGPRILLMMKAALLTPPPQVRGVAEAGASLLAVIDLDAGRGTLTIGIVAEYGIDPLVSIRIPVEAFFHLKERGNWHIYLGQIDDPIQAKVILVFEGSGYLMISGRGLDHPKFPIAIEDRLAIGVGMHVELIWGSREVRIYAAVAGGFDALMSFQPFFLQGALIVRGELRLIIIGITAYAALDLVIGTNPETGQEIGHLEGEICGEIDLFFFKIKGCVDFAMGEMPGPPIPDLVEKVAAVSRSPALLPGSGADTPIDAVLAEGIVSDSPPSADAFVEPSEAEDDDPRPRRIPIDAVLAVSLTASPRQSSFSVLGETFSDAAPGSTADGFTQRADLNVFYALTGVTLVGGGLTPGSRPAVWWAGEPATKKSQLVQLALLTWVPSPFSAAIERSEFLTQTITDRWGTVCHNPAPAAPVLWAFHDEPLGASAEGWVLRGKVWPDPPETVRSEEPDLDIDVAESWRSGLDVDVWRGIIGSWIVGNQIACADGVDPPRPGGSGTPGGLETLSVAATRAAPAPPILTDSIATRTTIATRTPVAGRAGATPALATAGAGTAQPVAATLRLADEMTRFTGPSGTAVVAEAPSPRETLRRLHAGEAVGSAAFLDMPLVAPTSAGLCDARVLSSPLLDYGSTVSQLGDATQADAIEEAWAADGFVPSTLVEAVRLYPGGFAAATLLLAPMRAFVEGGLLVVRVLDADEAELGRIVPTVADFVPPQSLPPRWTDASGPWFADVDHAVRFHPSFTDPIEGVHNLLLVDLPAYEDATIIEIGFAVPAQPPGRPPGTPSVFAAEFGRRSGTSGASTAAPAPQPAELTRWYYVLCVEVTRIGEARRESYDQQLVESDRGAVGRYLGLESGEHAMLLPDTLYGLHVGWTQHAEDAPAEAVSRVFWFHTTAEPPARLGPYLLLSLPNQRETHVFGHEPLKLVFSTPQVTELFAAFGLVLQVRLRAASFRQPDPEEQAEGDAYPFSMAPGDLEDLGPLILTPYEETLAEVLEGQCIAIDAERVRHVARVIQVPLDPLTDYVLDIVSVPEADPENGPATIVHSVAFATGAYPTLERFARVLQSQRTNHRWVEAGGMQAIAAQFAARQPEGSELDTALIGAGLEAMARPDRPRTTVFWEQPGPAAEPQPVAVLIDAPEPMRRTWELPTKETDESVDPPSEFWRNRPRVWLDLEPGSQDAGRVQAILRDPGGQRALVVLGPGARGNRVQVEMVRYALSDALADPEGATDLRFAIVDLLPARAPWEE